MSKMLKVGQKIPSVKVMISSNQTEIGACAKPTQILTTELFKGNTVLFAVPGAFTPTCHLQHLPGFVKNISKFNDKGYKVFCLSTNDIFVLDAWGKLNGCSDKIKMVSDGNGEFAASLGVGLDLTKNLMGAGRTQRFGMILNEGIIKYFEAGDLDVSSADALLAKL